MDGKLPQTFLQGLLSGFGHPVIGVDHLAAIVGVGILAALAGRSAAVVLAFSVAVIAGVGLHLSRIDLPASELFVGLTTLLIGALVILRQSMSAGRALLLFAIAGLVHGYALGESIVGAEASPLMAYLLGLLVMQTAIGVVVYAAVRSLVALAGAHDRPHDRGRAGGDVRAASPRQRRQVSPDVTTTILYVCVTCRGNPATADRRARCPASRRTIAGGGRAAARRRRRQGHRGGAGQLPVELPARLQCGRVGVGQVDLRDRRPRSRSACRRRHRFCPPHRAHAEGVPEWRDRPEHVRKHTIARVPPVKPAAPSLLPSQEQP